jgi:hypothetical protein
MHDAAVPARLVGREAVLLLEQHDLVAGSLARERRRGGDPDDAAADDDETHRPAR